MQICYANNKRFLRGYSESEKEESDTRKDLVS